MDTVIFLKEELIRSEHPFKVESGAWLKFQFGLEFEPDIYCLSASFLTTGQASEYHGTLKQRIKSVWNYMFWYAIIYCQSMVHRGIIVYNFTNSMFEKWSVSCFGAYAFLHHEMEIFYMYACWFNILIIYVFNLKK